MRNRLSLSLAVVLFVLSANLNAQSVGGSFSGVVMDQQQAVMPGVAVTVREISTNIVARKIATDEQGNYEIPGLKQGTYQLTAISTGFKGFTANEIILASNQIRRIDIRLEVGGAEAEVTVTASAAVIETEQGKISAEFKGERYKDIPIPGNSYGATTTVLAVLPTVQTVAGSQGSPRLGGHGGNQVDMGTDGIKEETLNSQTINMESVEELKLVAVNNTAEYSRLGYFDTVTKRGGNLFHGEASYYHRNSTLGARGFFEKQKTRQLYHTFNGSGSGPIIKNRTFFYALWNAERVPAHSFLSATVPTPAQRTGDFSQFLTLARPVPINDPLTGAPFPGNIIPTSRLNAASLKVQDQFLPLRPLAASTPWLPTPRAASLPSTASSIRSGSAAP